MFAMLAIWLWAQTVFILASLDATTFIFRFKRWTCHPRVFGYCSTNNREKAAICINLLLNSSAKLGKPKWFSRISDTCDRKCYKWWATKTSQIVCSNGTKREKMPRFSRKIATSTPQLKLTQNRAIYPLGGFHVTSWPWKVVQRRRHEKPQSRIVQACDKLAVSLSDVAQHLWIENRRLGQHFPIVFVHQQTMRPANPAIVQQTTVSAQWIKMINFSAPAALWLRAGLGG